MYHKDADVRKTDVVAFRIPSEKVEFLRKEAKNRKVSVNVLANHILDMYFDFHLTASNAGFIYLPRKTVRGMINALRDEEIIILAKGPVRSDFIDLTYLMKGKLTLASFLNTILAWARDLNFPYRDDFEGHNRTITIHHNMGRKWSLLLKESLTTALGDLSPKVTIQMREDVIVVDLQE